MNNPANNGGMKRSVMESDLIGFVMRLQTTRWRMAWIGQGIAFSALVAAAVTLEVHDKPVSGLWLLIVIWAACADWHPKTEKSEDA